MSQTEERLFTLMAHAEDLQRVAQEVLANTNKATKRIETEAVGTILSAVRAGIDETLQETKKGLTGASTGLKEASDEAKATSAVLKRTGLMQGFFLLAVALVIGGVGFAVMGFIGKSKLAELNELKAAIRAEQSTLNELQSKTWGLELVNYQDGTRGIILPRGTKVDRSGAVQDGRIGIVVKP